MKSAVLLQRLEQQLATLLQQVAPLAHHATVSARFDRHLFQTRSTRMQSYLDESTANMAALRHAVEHGRVDQVVWLAEHLTAQIAALTRESAVWSLREWDHASPGIARWQRRRLKHQEYERRLLAMKQEREQRLRSVTTLVEQQQLQKEVEAFAGRLTRCRHALEKIEGVLTRLTR
ncbi:primosomal replication protein N'' [Kosakonia sacchari]|uniref:primosomal replication protein N'' n=1 Tax=Kosakonia sacchari TaxID=1158459 RepID=UPI0013642F22|nr:primosomal replication protein N'' [Kosakonia sacchari]QHM96054.1 primosomal replication protein N'' [Kosakonia sacchari]